MRKIAITLVSTLVYFTIQGCFMNTYERAEYIEYLADTTNGFHKIVEYGGVKYDFQYCSPEYMAVMESRNGNSKEYENNRKKFNQGLYFIMRIQDANDSMNPDFLNSISTEAMDELNFWMERNLVITCGTDTIRCVLSHTEPFNSEAHSINISMVFDKNENYLREKTDEILNIYVLDHFWNNGPVQISFEVSQLINRPTVRI